MTGLARLPTEILSLIAAHSTREGLKALRLTDGAFCTVATAKLFRELHISPNALSFDRAHSVAEHNHLNTHVRSLVYHFGKLAEVYAGFEAFKREYYAARRTGVSHDPYEITPEVLWCYNCWLEEIDAQRSFDLRFEADELADLCDRLPHLEAISTILDEASPFGDQEDYIGRRTGRPANEDDGWLRFPRLFAAANKKPLYKISARSIQWHDLGFMEEGTDEEFKAGRECLGRLRSLELGIYRTPHDFQEDQGEGSDKIEYLHHIDLLNIIFDFASKLETLRLDFDELPIESETEATLPVSDAIFKHHWPSLRELKLEALCVYEDNFCDFLQSHRASLRTLCIGDIELTSKDDERPSVLRMFSRLRQSLQLRSCRITGNFTNRIDQAWYVDTEYDSPDCLREQIESYICGNGKLDIELMDMWKQTLGQQGQDLPFGFDEVREEFEAFQDESWQWAPELLEEL